MRKKGNGEITVIVKIGQGEGKITEAGGRVRGVDRKEDREIETETEKRHNARPPTKYRYYAITLLHMYVVDVVVDVLLWSYSRGDSTVISCVTPEFSDQS